MFPLNTVTKEKPKKKKKRIERKSKKWVKRKRKEKKKPNRQTTLKKINEINKSTKVLCSASSTIEKLVKLWTKNAEKSDHAL